MTITFRDFISALRQLDLGRSIPIIAHVSLSAFGEVKGGAETILGALLLQHPSLMMPTFTYKTMITPRIGPPDNAIDYSRNQDANLMANFFYPDMPADKLMGTVAEKLRLHEDARRSEHPILSFSGIGVDAAIEAQTLSEPLAPIRVLTEHGGWVLLAGVDHTVNTSIHYAEKVAGRKQFTRWALTPQGIVECQSFPGCSEGFMAIAPHIERVTRQVQVGEAVIQVAPLGEIVNAVQAMLSNDPLALLCNHPECERCNEVRRVIDAKAGLMG